MELVEKYEQFFGIERTQDFEERVNRAAQDAIRELDKLVADEVKIRFVTHVYAKSLDYLSDVLKSGHVAN